ncbi:MAG TPA: phytanoyl-CoA dioxygenase family protein [Chloroflexota bacterium]|nr:phytanoyl-CoA dioxygenase family protein [Chloroflexota bacterium]
MALTGSEIVLSHDQVTLYHERGFLVIPGLLGSDEIDELSHTFDALHDQGSIPGCFTIGTPEEIAKDPLKLYPRMMHPHRVNDVARRYMIDRRLMDILAILMADEPLAAQSMFYWKPPKARGQALHQDNFYLRVYPGTCLAAWIPLDDTDEENGCLMVAPGSHRLDIFCPEEADPTVSFTRHFVPVPQGLAEVPVRLKAGDALFFGGNLIHGSYPNHSEDRFRRSFICHYIGAAAEEVARFYKPLYRRDGSEVTLADAPKEGGPCGGPEAMGPH